MSPYFYHTAEIVTHHTYYCLASSAEAERVDQNWKGRTSSSQSSLKPECSVYLSNIIY